MNKEIKTKIEEYVIMELDHLKNLDRSTEEYNSISDNGVKHINTLVELLQKEDVNDGNYKINSDKNKNEETKIGQDYEINSKKLECEVTKNKDTLQLENRKIDSSEIKNNSDSDLKQEELNIMTKRDIEIRTDRIIKVLIDGATIVIPIIFYDAWMAKGFKFEETGTFTSSTFKNLLNKFKPNK